MEGRNTFIFILGKKNGENNELEEGQGENILTGDQEVELKE